MARGRTYYGDLRRRGPRLDPRPRLLVCCEGVVTEKGYFNDLGREVQNQLLRIHVYARGEAPKTLVEHAVEQKREAEKEARRCKDDNLRYDEVWCVFDVDAHPHLPDAKQQARDNGIKLAISSPCFEIWVLLHFQDQTAHIDRDDLKRVCREHIPNYHKEVPYETLRPSYETAVRRAEALDQRQEAAGNAGGNPSTGVYRLTERIHELGRNQLLQKLIHDTRR